MTRKKHPFRPATRAIALEPRVLFDGAAAVAVADHSAFSPERDHLPQDAGADHGATKPAAADATLARPATDAPAPSTIVIIDARVADHQSLLPGLPANALVRVVQADESGLAAISQSLQGRSDISSVQIIGHGTPGQFTLGSDRIDSSTLATQATQAAQLQSWAPHLTAHADILLYGCEIAQGAQGMALLTQIASLTGADIAASIDPTGAASRGGDWTLEAATGAIEAQTLAFQSYDHLLADTAITDANAATPRTTAEDTPLAISGLSIGDADDPAIMTLRVQTTGGAANVTALGGATVSAGSNGTADFTLSGSMAQINAALATLQYTPEANQNSSTTGFAPQIVLTATDVSNGGSGSVTITNIAVTAVNDPPKLGSGVALTVSEGGSSAFSLVQLATDANTLDVDILTGQQVLAQQMVTITSLPTLGTLSYNGGAVALGSVIPVSSLGNLKYTHNGADIASNSTDSFGVTVSDGGGAATSGTLSITITPKNVAPTVSGSPTLIEGQVKVVAPTINLGDSHDTLANATIVIDNIDTGGQGTLFLDANGNNVVDAGEALSGTVTLDASQRANLATQLKFFQNGAEPNAPGAIAPSYQIHVTDAGGGEGTPLTADQTITLTVQPNNDDPTLANAHASADTALNVAERVGGSPVILTAAMLRISDADRNPANTTSTTPADQLVYTIGTPPTQGEIQLYIGGTAGYGGDGWITLGDGGRFTQADVDAGKVRYYQTTNVTTDTPDSFTFTVRDSAFGYDVWTDPANPTGGREGGLRDTPTGAIATQSFHINVTADATPGHDTYEGPPRPPTPGYGGGNMTYTFAPGTMTNGNDTATWNEANVAAAGGGYVITSGMLSYTITRIDNRGTPGDTTDDVSVTIPPAETVYTLTNQPPNGTVERNVGGTWTAIPTNGQFTQADIDAGNIRFVHDGSENHTASFGYTVSDGTPNHHTSSFALNITPANDRPTASGGTAQVTEGNANAVRLGGSVIGMNDVDLSQDPAKQITGEGAQDFLWFQITDVARDGGGTAHGSLQRWNGSAWVTVNAGEWLPSTLLTASVDGGTSGLRYVHDGSEPLAYSGGPNLRFSYVVRDDLANPGNPFAMDNTTAVSDPSGSAQSNQSVSATATIQVISVNNAPLVADKPGDPDPSIGATITDGGALTGKNEILANVPEGGTATITSAYLTAIDPDNTTIQRQYRITQAPTLGVLQLNGATLGVGSTFTQADIDAGKVTYKHNGTEVGTPITDTLGTYNDKFLFAVNDGVAEDSGNAFLITLTPTNDKPTLTAPTGPIDIDSADAANNKVTGFSIADPDLADGVSAGETDFVQATVRILDASGNPISNYTTGFAGGGVSIGYDTGSGVTVTRSGTNDLLQVQGTRAQVNAALAGLSVTFANDTNARYKLEVIVDDRMRDASGNLTTTGSDANGGEQNQAATPGGAPTPVPGTNYDWKTAASPAANDPNLTAATVDLRASRVNETPTFTGPSSLTINEDTRTKVSGFTVADPESAAFDTPVTVTVSVGSGTLDIGAVGAQSSVTPSGGQAVTISGDNSASVTLTGRAADIQALLNGKNFAGDADDSNGGLFYTGASNVNHDTNGDAAGDVTLTLTFDDAGSRIGGDVGAGSVAANPANIVSDITLTAINDAPTVNRIGTPVTISDTTTVAVSGFSIGDVDSNDGYATGETDGTIQATVRVLDGDGNPLIVDKYTSLGIFLSSSASVPGVTVDTTLSGNNAALELRGTLTDINAYLAGLQIQFTNPDAANINATHRVEVIADDRLRDAASGAILNPSSPSANGGANNQQTDLPLVPSTDTFDAYATKVSAYGVYNVVSNTRPLFISSINDPGVITASDVTVNEGAGTLTLNAGNAGLGIADPDDNGATTMSTTVTVSKGTISTVGGAGGSVSGLGTSSITITGATEAQLNSRLQALTIAFPDETGAPTPADWNGSFTVTVTYNDNGNTGTRPSSLTGDTDNPAAYPGDYSYADGSSNILITTRTFTVTVNGVNDAPTRTDATPVTLPAATEDTDGGSGDTVNNLFAGKFSDALDSITGGSSANSFAGIAITANTASTDQGKWQYSSDGGTTWTDLPAVSTSSALLLDTSAKLRFDPAADFHGAPGGLEVRLIDSSGGPITSGSTANVSGANSGGSTRYSDAGNAVTLTTTVSNVNDRPTGADTTLTSIPEDSTNPTGATVASLGFGYADATDNQAAITGGGNASTSFGGIAIVGNTANASVEGVWQYSTDGGSTWAAVGTPSDTSVLILPTDASLRFVPVANYNGTPGGLSVRVADSAQTFSVGSDISATVGVQTGTWSATHTLGTTVTPLNDAPTLTNTATNPAVTENTSTGSGTSIDPVALLNSGTLGDIDLTTTAVLSAPTFGAGTITVALTDGVAGDVLQIASGVTAGIASTSGGTGNTPLVITLANAATVSDVEAILAAIQYKNTSDNPTNFGADTTRSYTVVLNDGNNAQPGGNAGGPAALNAATINGTITLAATNDPPVGVDDSNTVTEDTAAPATGNVITDGTPDHDPDNTTAELSVAGVRTGTEIGGGTAGTLGTPLAGQYGSLTIGADGSYSYALDNTNPAVNALLTGQTLTETFTYTVRDPGGLTDTAQLTITIHGNTDGGPSIAPVDGNGAAAGEATVHEHGLTSPTDTTETTTGTISITAADGLAKVSINGTDVTLSALDALATTPVTITTTKGTLTLTGYASTSAVGGVSTAGTLSYSYTLAAALDQPGTTESADDFTLGVTDQSASSATGTLTVQIIDDVPTATADTHTVTEGATLTVAAADGVLRNDSSGADGWAAGGGVVGVTAGDTGTPTTTGVGTAITGSYGTLTLAADGSYTYTTTANSISADATDVFTYTVQDSDGDQTTATLTIQVSNVSVPSTPASNTVHESGLANGSTPGVGNSVSNASLGLPTGATAVAASGTSTYGSYTVNADGTYSYTLTSPTSGDATTDSFTYTATDANGNTVINTVTIAIVDDVPTARPDTHDVTEDTAPNTSGNVFTGTAGGDQADTQGADGASVTGLKAGTEAGPVSGSLGSDILGSYGTLTLGADGSYGYALDNAKPAMQALGVGETLTDTFTYTITDGDGDTSTTTLTITIHGANDAPLLIVGSLPAQANPDSTAGISIHTAISFIDFDGDTLTYTAAGLPPGLVIDPATGIITGTLDHSASQGGPGHDGVYTVSVTANDGHGGSATQTFTYTVTNPAPIARDDTRTTAEDTPVSGNVISGSGGDVADSDPDGDPLQVTQIVVGGQTHTVAPGTPATVNLPEGTLVFSSDGSYTFTPTKDWNGIVPGIGYTISDAEGGTASATLHITVTPVVDIADDSASTPPGTPVTTNVLGNDSFKNPGHTVTGVTQGAHGSVTINPDGTITYTPTPGYVGNDSYTYTVTSGGVTETATVTVNLMAENPPLAVPPFSATPPAPPVASLQPRDPLAMSPVVSDPGVFFVSERSDTVLRLPIPLHPITYVEGAVEQAQQARAATDPLLFSNPAAVRAGEVQSTSIGAGLGFDPVVFVAPAVRGSQALGQWLGDLVDGRLERLSLSSDREIPTPELAQPDPQQLMVMPREADKPHTEPAEKPTHAKGHKKSADAGSDAVEHAPQALRAAPSFSDQLRVSLKRPVATLHARFNGH